MRLYNKTKKKKLAQTFKHFFRFLFSFLSFLSISEFWNSYASFQHPEWRFENGHWIANARENFCRNWISFWNVINNVKTSFVCQIHIRNVCAERQIQKVRMQNDSKIYWKSNGTVKFFFYSTCLNGSWRSFPKIFMCWTGAEVFHFARTLFENERFTAK